jgi:hypothetical protein
MEGGESCLIEEVEEGAEEKEMHRVKRRNTMTHVSPVVVEKSLKGMHYPARKRDLVKHAQQQGADKEIVETLRNLPGENFARPTDVSKAIGVLNRQ